MFSEQGDAVVTWVNGKVGIFFKSHYFLTSSAEQEVTQTYPSKEDK